MANSRVPSRIFDPWAVDRLRAAEAVTCRHRELVLASKRWGCCYCLAIFSPGEIREWIPEPRPKGKRLERAVTALCPRCGIDIVLPEAAGFPLTRSFLGAMQAYWCPSALEMRKRR